MQEIPKHTEFNFGARKKSILTYIFSIFLIFKHMNTVIHNGLQYFLIMINALPNLVKVRKKLRKKTLLVSRERLKLPFCSVHSFMHIRSKKQKF